MELKGTVLNVVDFGAFVDIGLKDSGLVHISQLANRYVKSPHDVVSVGDVVTVWVMGVDHERKRVSLTMVKPGTERQRGAAVAAAVAAAARGRASAKDRAGPGPARRRRTPPAADVLGPHLAARGRSLSGRACRDPSPAAANETRRPPRCRAARAFRTTVAGRCPVRAVRPEQDYRPRIGNDRARLRPHGPGGPRGPFPGQGRPAAPARPRAQRPRPPSRPCRPAAPPPPLSKDALAGNVPLRTFGQLKQLWEARIDEPGSRRPMPLLQPQNRAPRRRPTPRARPPEHSQPAESPSPLVNESDNQTASSSS